MTVLVISAAFVGFVHSLAPGHWLPVVLMAKTRRWKMGTAALGALITASGHILLSIGMALIGIEVGAQLLSDYEPQIEKYAGLGLCVFGLAFAAYAYFRHSGCHGHTHHGPDPDAGADSRERKQDLRSGALFLFSVGFSPCVAVLPVFAAAAPHGIPSLLVTILAFAVGVSAALVGSTVLTALGILRLDHPIFEHYGDVITGLGVAGLGVLLFLLPGH